MSISLWVIATPTGRYAPHVRGWADSADECAREAASRVWFFAAHELRSLVPEAVNAAVALYEAAYGMTLPAGAGSMTYAEADWLARQLELAVCFGLLQFESIPELHVSNTLTDQAETRQVAGPTLDFIEITAVDAGGDPIVNTPYRLRLPDGRVITGITDAQGGAWSPPTPRGSCEFSLLLAENRAVPAYVTDFLEVVVVDDDGQPIANQPCELTLADGRVLKGVTDTDGKWRAPSIPKGSCDFALSTVDGAVWDLA